MKSKDELFAEIEKTAKKTSCVQHGKGTVCWSDLRSDYICTKDTGQCILVKFPKKGVEGSCMTFSEWFQSLLMMSATHGEFGHDHPMGTCLYRDVIRHDKVYSALKEAWKELVEPDEKDS